MHQHQQTSNLLTNASLVAAALGSSYSTPEHVIIAAAQAPNAAGEALAKFGWSAKWLVENVTVRNSTRTMRDPSRIHAGPRLSRILEAISENHGDPQDVTPTVVLRAILLSDDPVIKDLRLKRPLDIAKVEAGLPDGLVDDVDSPFDLQVSRKVFADPAPKNTAPGPEEVPVAARAGLRKKRSLGKALTAFGTDLTAKAQETPGTPLYGRETELQRIQTILARRIKANPILLGEAGVGKTALVEALAAQLAAGQGSPLLKDRPLIEIDMGSVLAGTRARGDFEDRMKKLLKEAETANAILFIDEIHQLMGAGDTTDTMNAANLLKVALSRGGVTLIGATTLDEYRKHIAADAAFERRFEPVRIDPPSVETTVAILSTLRHTYASHHQVRYTTKALEAAAKLTDRYVQDRQLPDKAIDALDEAGAAAALARNRITDPQVLEWYVQRHELREAMKPIIKAEAFEQAIPLAKEDKHLTAQIVKKTGHDLGVVTEADIAKVVAMAARMPVNVIDSDENSKLKTLQTDLTARIVGQTQAVETLAATVKRRRILGSDRPTSLLLAGPTGVGKTETAKALADILYGDGTNGSAPNNSLLRFDMSEFGEKHTVSRLIGAPPGYAGYDDGGELTERVRRNPHAIVLLDEVEKAHPDVYDVLLQVFEDGRLTDGQGRVVSFKDTIFLLTSNLGTQEAARPSFGFAAAGTDQETTHRQQTITRAVKAHFRPEFINRLDEIVVYNPLTKTEMTGIAANLLDRPLKQMAEKGVSLRISDQALELILSRGYDPAMGARPLRRAITNLLEGPLSDALLQGALPKGATAFVDVNADETGLVILPASPEVEMEAPITVEATEQ